MHAADIYDTLPGMNTHSGELLAELTTAREKNRSITKFARRTNKRMAAHVISIDSFSKIHPIYYNMPTTR